VTHYKRSTLLISFNLIFSFFSLNSFALTAKEALEFNKNLKDDVEELYDDFKDSLKMYEKEVEGENRDKIKDLLIRKICLINQLGKVKKLNERLEQAGERTAIKGIDKAQVNEMDKEIDELLFNYYKILNNSLVKKHCNNGLKQNSMGD